MMPCRDIKAAVTAWILVKGIGLILMVLGGAVWALSTATQAMSPRSH